ncbi:unnamed protein product [Heligmosomoides polygyrus]|uniref:Reverse transcriptase domain-containing protein n=1 Tax=Heligmosomoides polygyrus TaxID=6339 RepID=A0A183GU59_HELPZ|nr:unnamed protein product [Heligmosomoides polygyrus]
MRSLCVGAACSCTVCVDVSVTVRYVIPSVLPSEIRHAISSVKKRTAPGPDRIRAEHLKNLPPALINTLARLFTRYLSECKVPSQWKTSKTVLLYKKGDVHDIGNYRPICLLSVVYKLFTRVILNRISQYVPLHSWTFLGDPSLVCLLLFKEFSSQSCHPGVMLISVTVFHEPLIECSCSNSFSSHAIGSIVSAFELMKRQRQLLVAVARLYSAR